MPQLIYGDATPEALKWNLANGWPSGGVVSSEAGLVFGAHGMGKDSVMRNLATLNQLWDGADIATERRTTDSFTVHGARLTIALPVQETTLRSFFDRSGGLARATGFLARFLLAWPESTQGHRPFTDPPESWPALARFNQRIAGILERDVPIDEDGALSPDEESNIRAWLACIEETDPTIIAEVVDKCRNDLEARRYFLKRSKEVPEQVTASHSIACGDCIHFERIDHPHLGHCAKGEVVAAW